MKLLNKAITSLAIAGMALALAPLRAAVNPKPTPPTSPAASAMPPAEVYKTLLDEYLSGDWATLDADLVQKAKGIKALSKDQAADITYVQKVLVECRPAWWNQTKLGKRVLIHPTLWGKTMNAVFDPQQASNIHVEAANNQLAFFVNWPFGDMDSNQNAEHGFTKGDLTNFDIWGHLEVANVWAGMNFQKFSQLSKEERDVLQRYTDFRRTLAGTFYGTPRARRWGSFLSFDAYFGSHRTQPGFIPRRPLAAMLVVEIATHPDRYPSLHLPTDDHLSETVLATSFMTQFERTVLTLPEDKALRDAIRDFAQANTTAVFSTGKVTLPNKQTIALNPDDDDEQENKRNSWIRTELGRP